MDRRTEEDLQDWLERVEEVQPKIITNQANDTIKGMMEGKIDPSKVEDFSRGLQHKKKFREDQDRMQKEEHYEKIKKGRSGKVYLILTHRAIKKTTAISVRNVSQNTI